MNRDQEMNRFRLANCMGHANIVLDTSDHGKSRFFDDGTLAAESRRDYSIADRQAVVYMLNQSVAGVGRPAGWMENEVVS